MISRKACRGLSDLMFHIQYVTHYLFCKGWRQIFGSLLWERKKRGTIFKGEGTNLEGNCQGFYVITAVLDNVKSNIDVQEWRGWGFFEFGLI